MFRLNAAGSGDEWISLTAPSTSGTYYYGACVEGVSGESDTTNNCSLAVTVTVGAAPAPDLVVDTPTVSESAPAAGALFTLNATVRNQGSGPADSTTLRYYQSTDSTITTGDTEVGTDSVFRLNASQSGDESISLTAPSDPGTYYYGACVEAVSDESDTTNNCSLAVTVTVGAAPAPDLMVDTPTVSESAPAAGALFTLSATVRNQGSGASDSTTLRHYQSTDPTVTIGDAEVGTDSVSRLNASQGGDESITLTAPSTLGTYYYGACVDAVSGESDTTNNCSPAVTVTVGAAPAPDLMVDTPTVSESAPAAGARFTLNATVRNQGNGRSDSTTLRYYQSTDTTITTGDTEVGTDLVFRLNAAGSGDESISLTVPSTPGTYYYGACVEAVSGESDMTNNCSLAVTVTVGAAPTPDLVVDVPTVDTSAPVAGARFTLNATVRNQGNGRSDSTTLRYYQSTDSTITTGDTEVGTDSVSGLDASESGDESISLTAPSDPGTYYYGACVDAVSDESDTQNNCSLAVTVTVGAAPAPDLVVDAPTVSESAPAAGARFSLNATVRNQGNGPSAFTTLRYYQSTDSTITTDDTEVGTDSVFRINAAGSGDESIILTAPSTPGTYYYGTCVDAVSHESDTTNNCSAAVTVTVGAAPAPDLVVDAPTVSESAPAAGARFTLSATVRNQGNGSADSTTLRYYQSSDSTITTGDTEVGTDSVSRLDASESGDESISLTASSTPGTYYYGACVDAVYGEFDTTNNCSPAVTVTVGAAPAPDLVVDTPTVSESAPAAGARFTLSATVRNQGNGSADSTTLRYYQSSDSTITTGDTEVGTDSVFRLDASESGDESISLTASSTPGTYYYAACVDAVSDESDTTNNCSPAVTVTVGAAPAPDLVVDVPTVDTSAPVAGARFTLSATVRNQGNGRSDSTTLRYYQSTDTTITTDDTEVGTDSVFRLNAAGSGDEWISLTAPSTSGTYYYGACVDAVSDESDTTNNCSLAVTVTVGAAPAPDLMVDAPTVSESAPAAGARFTLSDTIRNQGNGPSAFTTLRYYQSTDSTITIGDAEVGTDSVSRLNASESGDESISLTAPSSAGTYYYGACVDAVSDESDTTNNCSVSVTVTVGAAPAPDLVVDAPTVSESAPAAGARFSLNATVRNQGSGSSAFTTLRYYRSTDSTITTGDTEVGTDSVFRLDASESGDESISLTAPATPGAYYYGACVETVSGESDTTNNCSAAVTVTVGAAPAPDLVMDVPTVDASAPAAGARFTLSATVRNQGNGTLAFATLRYYQSTDSTITTGDTEVGTDSVSRLDPSEGGEESISLTAPSTPGAYYYGACVDAASGESDTTNNCSPAVAVTVGAAPAPDLVVDTPTVSDSAPAAGARFTLSATVRNQGAARSGSTTLRYYQSTDATIAADDTEVGTDSVFGLAASASGDESISLTAPSTPGTYYYGACVDEVAGELDTTNNCSAVVQVAVSTTTGGNRYNVGDALPGVPTSGTFIPAVSSGVSLQSSGGNTTITFGNGGYIELQDGTRYTCESLDGCEVVNGEVTRGTIVGQATASSSSPDLVVDTPMVSESSPTAGASFTLSATVRNQGAARSDSTTLRYYQSTDSTITTSDTEVGTDSVSRLDASESGDESISLDAPSTPGTYYYGACVEAVSGESDTTNNCSPAVTVTVGAAPAPDLVVDAPTVDTSAPTAGASFTLNATVRNQGSGSSSSTTLRYYRSTDATITTSDTSVGTDSVSGLNASGSSPESITLTAPSTAGTYYYGACVDSVSNESDRTNNCSTSATVAVGAAPAPDLVVKTPTVSESSPAAGGRFTLSAMVRNQGSGSSSSAILRYYRSNDTTIATSDTEAGTDSVSGLGSTGSSNESIDLTAPSDPGTYYYGACVDAVTGESDTNNNCSSAVTVTVGAAPAPDLVVDMPAVSESSPTTGASFTLSATVRNQGNGSSSSTTLRYYRSTDSAITTSDAGVGTDSVSGLSSTGSSDESISLTAPSDTGTYYYGVCVDSVSGESDTTNNCSSAVAVTIGSGNTYGVGDLLPGVPTTGLFIPAVTVGASLSSSGGNTTITFTNGGYIELQDGTRFTCQSTGGCGVHNGEVTQGTIVGESTSVSTSDLIVDPPTVSESAPTAGTSFTLSATMRNQGNGSSDSTTLRYYQSTDSTITTGDTEVGTDSVGGLSAAGSGDESISLTAPDTPGTYYYGACVEAVSDESDATNNCSVAVTVTVVAVPLPDLVVDTPTVSDSAPAIGARFTLSATVRNQGSGWSGSTTLRYYQSTDPTITTGDTEVGTDSVRRLEGSETGNEYISLPAPSPGTYYYGACVDSVSDETDTSNNCSAAVTVAIEGPDLVVGQPSLAVGARAIAGQAFGLYAVVDNHQGSAPSAMTTLRFYQSTDTTITTVDTEIGTASVSPLGAPGGTIPNIRLTAPSTAGTYYYGACVDAVSGESDTTNNCSTALTVIIGPDLVVATPTVSNSSPAAGESFTLSTTVRNRGNMSSVPTTLRYIRSADSTITTSDTELGTDQVSNLSVTGGVPVQSVTLTAPSDPGTYYYGACVDSVTGEIDTANNCSGAVTVTVGAAPDLVVDTPTVSESAPAASTSFTVSVTVRNQGSSSAGFTTLRYYGSIDEILFPELPATTFREVPFHTDHVGGLAPSGSSTHSISLRAWDWETTRYYKACVDSVTGENNAANNCSAPVAVYVTGTPDLVVDTPMVSNSSPIAGSSFALSATVRNEGNGSSLAASLFYYRSADSTISSSDLQEGSGQVSGLSVSGASVESTSLTSPADPGTYYYGACVDSVTGESDTTNNCSAAVTVTVVPAPGPDLVVDTPTASDIHPIVGTVFVLYATVRNQGADASGPATLLFYRSTDSTITTSDERIGAGSTISGLSPTETDYLSDSSRAPSTPGTYYYGACVVSSKDESNTANNCSPALTIIPGGQPDLVVETPWISHSSATAVSYIDLHAVVRNQGTGPVQGFIAATFDVFLSTDSTIGLGDTRANGFLWRHMNISSGSEEGLTVSFHVPSTAGEYYYYACVEVVRGESDTTNNCSAAVKVTVRPPDLTILLPTVSSYSTTAGESFTLYATVLNQGDVRSADTTTIIRYYRSTDATITSEDTLVLGSVGADWVLVPNAHATTDRSTSLTAPSKTGTYYYGACVDAVSGESDTTNNCSEAVEVTVGPRPLSLRLTNCFVFQNQHFVRFQVTANVDLSSVVVHTYQVEGRNNKLHLMQTINVGNLAAGSSYSKLTSRYFPAHLRRHLTTCTASLEWDDGTAAPGFTPDLTTVPDLPPPPPTYTPPTYDPSEFRTPTKHQVYGLFGAIIGTIYRHHMACGHAGAPPCPGQDHIAWWSALPSGLQRCAFVGGCHFPQDPN